MFRKKESEYLKQYFLSKKDLAHVTEVTVEFINEAVAYEAVPGASYTVKNSTSFSSFIFESSIEETSTEFFHKDIVVWVNRAKELYTQNKSFKATGQIVQDEFKKQYLNYISKHSSFSEEEKIAMYLNTKKHLKEGTYGVCVLDMGEAENIAAKQLAAYNLSLFTDDGQKPSFNTQEKAKYETLVQEYNKYTMPFAPWDYPNSSRKRLVDNLQKKLNEEV